MMVIHKILQLGVLMMGFCLVTPAFAMEDAASLKEIRISHAKELLGRSWQKKVVRKNESADDVQNFVKASVRQFLPKKEKVKAAEVSKAILEAASEYELDPIFLMAVIQNESSFNPKKVGGVGEIGLMQIRPSTAEWIAGLYEIKYRGPKSLYQPAINVRIGAALMDKLRQQFDSASRLYLSAYNIGPKKVRQMISENKNPKEYVQAVMKRYIAFYEGFKTHGDSLKQSKVAWQSTMNLTRKPAAN